MGTARQAACPWAALFVVALVAYSLALGLAAYNEASPIQARIVEPRAPKDERDSVETPPGAAEQAAEPEAPKGERGGVEPPPGAAERARGVVEPGVAKKKGERDGRADSSPPDSAAQAAEEYGGIGGLCDYWGWQPRAPGVPRARLFYGVITGNNGQTDMYELHFLEVSPFVSRIVALDPKMTFRGHPRNLSLDMSLPNFSRFGDQLRHLVVESPLPGKTLPQLSPQEKEVFVRPGKELKYKGFLIEKWTRAQMARGFQDAQGRWEMNESDVVLVADSDEIPMPHALAALQLCEVPQFARAQEALSKGSNASAACQGALLRLHSQVFEYFADCPTKRPLWMHPDAAPAACLMRGAMDCEDVRTGGIHGGFGGRLTKNVAGRHLHNVGMPVEDIAYKYGHYSEPRVPRLDAGLDVETNQEMMWRGCDANAPNIGPGNWYMKLRPSNDMISKSNSRGYSFEEGRRGGLEKPFAILRERPEVAEKIFWVNHSERRNPFIGKPGGTNFFDH